MSAIAAALLSILSAVLVAVLTHLLSAKRKRQDELADFRLKAYGDFVNAASRLAIARRLGHTKDELLELTELNDAKARICICAPTKVVYQLSEYWKHGGTLEGESEILAFTRMCNEIRTSLGNEPVRSSSIELSNILFKLQPSSYSHKNEKTANTSSSSNRQLSD